MQLITIPVLEKIADLSSLLSDHYQMMDLGLNTVRAPETSTLCEILDHGIYIA